jgi:hypothetical protein
MTPVALGTFECLASPQVNYPNYVTGSKLFRHINVPTLSLAE